MADLPFGTLPLLLPGVALNTDPNGYAPVEQRQLSKFDGKKWALFGEVLGATAN